MTQEQKDFHTILLKHGIESRSFFTSNEFSTIWNAVEEYQAQFAPKKESVTPPVSGRSEQLPPLSDNDMDWIFDKMIKE